MHSIICPVEFRLCVYLTHSADGVIFKKCLKTIPNSIILTLTPTHTLTLNYNSNPLKLFIFTTTNTKKARKA